MVVLFKIFKYFIKMVDITSIYLNFILIETGCRNAFIVDKKDQSEYEEYLNIFKNIHITETCYGNIISKNSYNPFTINNDILMNITDCNLEEYLDDNKAELKIIVETSEDNIVILSFFCNYDYDLTYMKEVTKIYRECFLSHPLLEDNIVDVTLSFKKIFSRKECIHYIKNGDYKIIINDLRKYFALYYLSDKLDIIKYINFNNKYHVMFITEILENDVVFEHANNENKTQYYIDLREVNFYTDIAELKTLEFNNNYYLK